MQQDCPITADSFAFTYMNIVKEMAIVDPQDGEECAVPDEGDNQMVVGEWVGRSGKHYTHEPGQLCVS